MIDAPKGTFDILPDSSHLWRFIERTAAELAQRFGYGEIRTPIFERTELFTRGVGDSSDIVTKEMYTFMDKGERSMTLRPEMTAPVVRAFIEHRLAPQKLYYIGPMFRYDRPQAGRFRQFHQFGAEIIGGKDPLIDAEVIDLLMTFYKTLGIKDLNLYINSVGDAAARKGFSAALRSFLSSKKESLSADSQRRLETNCLRILDSKDPADHALLEGAPRLDEFISEESRKYLQEVIEALKSIAVHAEVHPKLVRGLDYYNETVFEVTSGKLGAQNTIGAGGRYDGLSKTLGGPDVPGIGFATGLERVLQMIPEKPPAPAPTLFFVTLGKRARAWGFTALHKARGEGISALMDFGGKKIKDQLKMASDCGCRFALIVGDEEMNACSAEFKDLNARTSRTISLDQWLTTTLECIS